MILAVFVGIFALMYRGGLHVESENMEKVMSLDEKLAIVLLLWASALISAFLDNIPFVATLIPMIQTMQQGAWMCSPCGGPCLWAPAWAATAALSAPAPTWC